MDVEYAHGWAVGSEDRNELMARAYKHLAESDKPNDEYDISTGDAFIYAFKRTDGEGTVLIEVLDCIVRREASGRFPYGNGIPEKLTINNG